MKKSKFISLVLISAALASCKEDKKEAEWGDQEVYMRGDTTAVYNHTHCHNNNALLLWMAFRPYGMYSNGSYSHVGMYSNSISERANVGRNGYKTSISSRGGFGGGSSHVSTSSSSSRGGFGSSSHSSSAS